MNQGFRHNTRLKPWIVLAAMILASMYFAVAAFADQDPTAAVRGLVDPALRILADKQIPLAQRQEQLRAIANRNFDFTAMSRSALGYHWKELSAQQQRDFTQTFSDFIEDAYLTRINEYNGQQVQYLGASRTNPGEAQVRTQIIQPDGSNPIPVNYIVRNQNGKWLVYDVTVDNISIIANYRNQFNRVMNDKGFDTLIADLKQKQQQLRSQLGIARS